MAAPSVGIAVITYKAIKQLPACLPPLLASPLKPRVLVVNSSSHDGTVELAQRMGAETLVIPRNEFNHGDTREKARKYLATDIVMMITPDAICTSPETVGNLVRPIAERRAAVSYARQIPHDGAGFFESFPRKFNYPAQSQLRGLEDVGRYGVYTFFCSNSCAAWSNAALDEIGGFQSTFVMEDSVAAAKLIHAGHKIAYCADAVVKHSHRYSLMQEFNRYFDQGYARRQNGALLYVKGTDEQRGQVFVRAMFGELLRTRAHLLPYAVISTAAKLCGYKLGCNAKRLPRWLLVQLGSQDYYWKSAAGKS